MKKHLLTLVFVFACIMTQAQQALWDGSPIVSPEIHPDNTVTFRLFAPKAVKVQVTGDFLPPQKVRTPRGDADAPGTADMIEENGVWEYTTPTPLAPELYSYTLIDRELPPFC